MLSLTSCREILGVDSTTISDAEIEVLRYQLYDLASITLNAFQANGGNRSPSSPFRLSLDRCFAETCIEVEERAAIMEFDGRLSRDEAERGAIARAIKDRNN